MNYSVELWDSYNKVENNLLFHLRGLKDFIYILQELNKSLKIFSNNLKKIVDMNINITTNESLSIGIENFHNFILSQHNFLEKYISNLISQAIDPLNSLQETILKKLNDNYKETISAEKNYESYISQIEFTRDKFHSRVKQVENKLLELEIKKYKKEKQKKIKNKGIKYNDDIINNDNEDEEEEIPEEEISSLEEQAKNVIGFAKDSEKIYLSYVKYTNRIQEEFIEIKKRNLNEIQSLEIELGDNIKNCLYKYYELQSNYIKNLNLENEQNTKLLEKIDTNDDIEIYIKNNRTNDIPPFKFDYSPYICNLEKQNIYLDDENMKNINLKVKEEIKKLFPDEKDISLLRTKTDKEIENLINNILDGINENEGVVNVNEENIKIVSNKNLRRIFLKYLNKLRNNTHIILNDISYKLIGNLLKESLEHSYKEKDFLSIKLIMVIATNLFKINKISNKPRIFLHNYLINNQIWKDFNFWESLIKYDIVEEIHNQKKYSLFLEENDILKNIRIKDTVKAQIGSNLYNMISFEVNSSLMNKIINYFSNFYKLPKNTVDYLNDIINNSKTKKIVINDKKKLNSSFDSALRNKKKNKIINKNNKNNKNNVNNNISSITTNNSKKNLFELEKDFDIKKKSSIIEPVKQDEQQINDCFREIDKEINNNNIFNDSNFNNIIIKESTNKITNKKQSDKDKKDKKEKEEKKEK